VNTPPAFLTPRRTPEPAPDVSHLPGWARLAYEDLVTASRTVGAGPILDELAEDYLTLTGPEERCWPARAYWRELARHMGESRRRRLALARLWPEFLRFRQGRRSPGCTEVRRLLLAGGRPRGLDCLHAARCEHCRMFSIYVSVGSTQ
jgi:hypothetical protein